MEMKNKEQFYNHVKKFVAEDLDDTHLFIDSELVDLLKEKN